MIAAARTLALATWLAAPLHASSIPDAWTSHASVDGTQDATRFIEEARGRQAQGELAAARESWLAASALLPIGAERDDVVGRARELEMRLALRSEIIADFKPDQRLFAEIRVEAADDAGLKIDGKLAAWKDVPLDTLRRATAIARASRRARAGLVLEALERGTKEERDQAFLDLGRMLEQRDIDAGDASSIVAHARGERLPRRGYVFRDGRWTDADALADAAQASGLEGLARRFETANAAQRQEGLAALAKLGPEAEARLAIALETRWKLALQTIQKGSTLGQLAAIAEQRRELDRRRAAALALIFDEDAYFYPYSPPECPAEKAKLYAGVQQRVDELVASVRETWKASRRARLQPAFRAALEELGWNREQQAQRALVFATPAEVPDWIGGIDPALDEIDLRNFAWDGTQRAELARDRAVLALDERLWKSRGFDASRTANSEEQQQVRITNEYRAMLGRRALAWNAKIQSAAQGHSDVMSTSGDFSHFEKDEARRTPADRLRLEGYKAGGSENISAGDTGAEGAHVGWLHSSGHHRNILEEDHREMASAISGNYWTQNFGDGAEFELELPH